MADATRVRELREEMKTKSDKIEELLKLAGQDFGGFDKAEIWEKLGATDRTAAVKTFHAWNAEVATLAEDLEREELKYDATRHHERLSGLQTTRHVTLPGGDLDAKSVGQRFIALKGYKQAIDAKQPFSGTVDIDIKTLMTRAAGFPPESVRSGRLVSAADRPIQVLDLIPSVSINQAVYKYMAETTLTHGAGEKAEGTTFAESTFEWTEVSETVQKITDSVPVTDEQLEDEPQIAGVVDQRLAFGLRQRLDLQVLVGDGTSPNLSGVLDRSIQSQALGGDDQITAFYKALTLVRFTGRANPSAAVFHPNDWQAIILLTNSNGDYLFGNPFMGPGPMSLLGVPIAVSDAITENTALVGDWANFSVLAERRGVNIQVGYTGTQFVEGKSTVRADLRVAFGVLRDAAFCKLTGI